MKARAQQIDQWRQSRGPLGGWGPFSTAWGEKDDTFPFWGAESGRGLYCCGQDGKMHERRMCGRGALWRDRRWSGATTELSERGEEYMPLCQTPAPCHDSGMKPCPAQPQLSYRSQTSTQTQGFWFILEFWRHYPAAFLEVLQGETQIKMCQKESDKHTWGRPCAVRCGGWRASSGECGRYIVVTAISAEKRMTPIL